MIEDELIKIWQSSSSQERLKFEKSKLMIELQSSLGRLHRWWMYIERVNVISALISIPPFIFIVYWVPFTYSKIAGVLIILWMVNLIIRMLGIKKFKPNDLDENYLDYIKKSRTYLEVQKNLLETSFYRVNLPFYPITFLFWLGMWELPEGRYILIITYLMLVSLGIHDYFLNKRRVKIEIMPRINRIDELIESLEE